MARDAHKDRRFNFVPGCGLVFKREAGLPVDRMVSYLVELEYLRTDDLTEFEEVLRQVIAGKSVWSMQRTDLNCVESTSKGGDTMPLTAKRDLKYHPAAIRARLAKLPPYKRETVKRLILETLHAMERKRGIDLTAEIQAVSDA